MKPICCILVMLACLTARAIADDALKDFRAAPEKSAYGTVSQIEFTSDWMVLKSGALAFCAEGSMKNLHFAEPVWILGYKTEVFDETGKPPRENHLCHTFFGDHMPMDGDENVMRSLYSDSFTREVRLPEGFAVPLKAAENLHWMPMFNNRGDQQIKVSMKFRITLIRERDLKKPLQPLFAIIRSVQSPDLFYVPPGRQEQQATFTFPANGRIHFVGTHIHPHGESVELFNVTKNERVWKGLRKLDTKGEMVGMDVYTNRTGYTVKAGEQYRITSAYHNPTDHWIDAMAGVFIFFSKE
ncbi:MAG: hypothetical protein U0Y68_15985 [Blastocatellia bacterium]